MSNTVQLVVMDMFETVTETVDLMAGLSSATGIVVTRDGWQQQVAGANDESVIEVITVRIKGSSADDLADKVQVFSTKIRQIQNWIEHETVETYQVWLRAKLNGETGLYQAQVLSLRGKSLPVMGISMQLYSEVENYELTIERTPLWEEASWSVRAEETHASLNCIGGMVAMSGAIGGDAGARVTFFNAIATSAGGGPHQFDEFWFGFKTDRYGCTPANFVSVWPLHNASWLQSDASDTTVVSDTAAYDGSAVEVAFTHTDGGGGDTVYDMYARVTAVLSDMVSAFYWIDQRGTYAVLLRARCDDYLQNILVRQATGFAEVGSGIILAPDYGGTFPVNGTDYKLYELGQVSFPPLSVPASYSLENCAIEIDALRAVTLTAKLRLDCLVLIPIDDSMIYMNTDKMHVTTTAYLDAWQDARRNMGGVVRASNVIYNGVRFGDSQSWCIPRGASASQLVTAAQSYTVSTKTDKLSVGIKYAKRWFAMRGNE
jgi:hypothetical protein